MSKKQKQTLARILASAALLIACVLLPLEGWPRLILFLIPLRGHRLGRTVARGAQHRPRAGL